MIKAEWFYWLVGALFLMMAAQMLTDRGNPRRRGSAAFWGLLGLGFVYGTWVADGSAPAEPLGAAVLVMVCLAGFGLTGRGTGAGDPEAAARRREAGAERFGGRLFVPALTVPAVALVCAVGLKKVHWNGEPLLQKGSETVLGLGIGAVTALVVGMVLLREKRPAEAVHAGRSMLESMGFALLLPQLLATLGAIFSIAGVGEQVRRITTAALPEGSVLLGVVVYCAGMFLFTVVMGNGFAAFPVMTAAVGWPVLVEQAHGNAPAVLAVGMLAGFCGTLVTPMAANYNLVPAALLELTDQYGPIKAQLPTAFILLGCNMVIMYVFAV
ncbi:DUF979 domain-containing protein [Streptomyces sp. I05A-00742]|uniref:DUF979 domain-containing protein n=1 Tax=Streptomyces sp. I05A-00742 TaxID=2732853 RepID=UPI001489BE0D|nr:DUF979 domain-containing protein [Streptomyces sp. I05A-00742]